MPEYNLIQAPELLRRATLALGLRQMHVSPTLNEGLQGVIILADVSKDPSKETRRTLSTWLMQAGAAKTAMASRLINDPASGVVARIQRVWVNVVAGAAVQGSISLCESLTWTTPNGAGALFGLSFFVDGKTGLTVAQASLQNNSQDKVGLFTAIVRQVLFQWVSSRDIFLEPFSLVLLPGQSLLFNTETLLAAGVGTWLVGAEWTEEVL